MLAKRAVMLVSGVASMAGVAPVCGAEGGRPATFCNPLDLPYRFVLKNQSLTKGASCREAADPTMVFRNGEFWLFASKSGGYWHSKDMLGWDFVEPTGFPMEDYAPTVEIVNGKWLLTVSNGRGLFTCDDPLKGTWERLRGFSYPDPALFRDEDGKLFLYSGSSSSRPIMGVELDPKDSFNLIGASKPMIAGLDPLHHGWEARDVMGSDEQIKGEKSPPWIEGAWMNKHKGTYYLQYAAPATEMRGYGDGVYTARSPLGPFKYAPYNPFSYKPTGFIGSAGHSSTYEDGAGRFWHIASMFVGVGYAFDRRLGIFPAGYLPNGNEPDQLACNTYLGDYPQLAPGLAKDALADNTAGWMLLTLKKKGTVSSTLDEQHTGERAFDEDVSTSWAAATAKVGEWLQVDMGKMCRIEAIQFNFADVKSTQYDRLRNDAYRYTLEVSDDGTTWRPCVDKQDNTRDAPHEYVQLERPVMARYAKLTNVHTPAGAVFSVSGLRIFGSGLGQAPWPVGGMAGARPANRRVMEVSWQASPGADFYIVRYGIKPERLTFNYQVYSGNKATIPGLNTDVEYYFTVDAVNDTGVTKGVEVKPVAATGG